MSASVDARPDKAPPAARASRELQALALTGATHTTQRREEKRTAEGENVATAAPEQVAYPEAERLSPLEKAVYDYAGRQPDKRARFSMAGASFEFRVAAVSVNSLSLAFFLDKDVKMDLEPGTGVVVTVDGNTYDVVYIGGFFPFPNIGYNLISFLFKREDG